MKLKDSLLLSEKVLAVEYFTDLGPFSLPVENKSKSSCLWPLLEDVTFPLYLTWFKMLSLSRIGKLL